MTTVDEILIICFVVGIVLMIWGCIIANIAAQEMRRVLNENRSPEDQLRWHDAIQRVAQNIIDLYRAAYPEGPLYRKLVRGYSFFGIGAVLGVVSAVVLRIS